MIQVYKRYADLDLHGIMKVYSGSARLDNWNDEVDFMDDLRLFFRCDGAYLAVWQINDISVSSVRIEPYEDGYLISCLETAPEHRRKGFARDLLQEVMDRTAGIYYAHVDKRNKASLALHKQLGFSIFLDHAVYVDGSVYSNSFTLKK